MSNTTFRSGEVYMITFGESGGGASKQCGLRPGIIVQNNKGNEYSPNVIAVPLTTSLKKRGQPTHVYLDAVETGLKRNSMALCENPELISKERVGEYVTTLPFNVMEKIAYAYMLTCAMASYLDFSSIMKVWEESKRLNCVRKAVA